MAENIPLITLLGVETPINMNTTKLRAYLVAIASFALGTPLFGVLVFSTLSLLWSCPPERPACDMPDIAAFGIACVLAPILSTVLSVVAFKRFAKSNAAGIG